MLENQNKPIPPFVTFSWLCKCLNPVTNTNFIWNQLCKPVTCFISPLWLVYRLKLKQITANEYKKKYLNNFLKNYYYYHYYENLCVYCNPLLFLFATKNKCVHFINNSLLDNVNSIMSLILKNMSYFCGVLPHLERKKKRRYVLKNKDAYPLCLKRFFVLLSTKWCRSK